MIVHSSRACATNVSSPPSNALIRLGRSILAAMLAYALRQAVLRKVSDAEATEEAAIAGLERGDEGGV